MSYKTDFPQNQYSILETFSPNTADNINQVSKFFFGMPEVPGDLSSNLIIENTGVPGGFELQYNGTKIIVLPGTCLISGVQLNIGEVELDPNDVNNYLYSSLGDGPPTTDGYHVIILAVEYNPTSNDPNAYIGFIVDTSIYHEFSSKLCFLWAIGVHISTGNWTLDPPLDYDPEDFTIGRTGFWDIVDGGWVG